MSMLRGLLNRGHRRRGNAAAVRLKTCKPAAGLAGELAADRGARISGRGVGTGQRHAVMSVWPGCSHFYCAGWTPASVLKR